MGSSSLHRDRTGPPAQGAQSLSHWTTREVPLKPFVMVKEDILRTLRGKGFPPDLTKEAFHRRHKPWVYCTSKLCGCELSQPLFSCVSQGGNTQIIPPEKGLRSNMKSP